jgi:hypothetical protein
MTLKKEELICAAAEISYIAVTASVTESLLLLKLTHLKKCRSSYGKNEGNGNARLYSMDIYKKNSQAKKMER